MSHSVADVLRFLQQFPSDKLFQTLLKEEPIVRRFFNGLLLTQTNGACAGTATIEELIPERLNATQRSGTDSTTDDLAEHPSGQRQPSADAEVDSSPALRMNPKLALSLLILSR